MPFEDDCIDDFKSVVVAKPDHRMSRFRKKHAVVRTSDMKYKDEYDLHKDIRDALKKAGLPYKSEFVINGSGRRADFALCFSDSDRDKPKTLVEAKVATPHNGIGQLLYYRELLRKKFPIPRVASVLVLVAPEIDDQLLSACDAAGIMTVNVKQSLNSIAPWEVDDYFRILDEYNSREEHKKAAVLLRWLRAGRLVISDDMQDVSIQGAQK